GEFLKIAYILFFANYLISIRKKVDQWKVSVTTFAIITAIPGIILLFQPDNDTLAIIGICGLAILIAGGIRFKHFFAVIGIGIMLAGISYASFSDVIDRVNTFSTPEEELGNGGYQIKQSLIAVGSGELVGRGFGKSVQKFHALPEPIGDSIFAVAGEEFGFVG